MLTTKDKRQAGQVIENTYRAYTRKGGVADAEKAVEQAHTQCSKHIYGAACRMVKETATLDDAMARFGEFCLAAEESLKRKHNVTNVKDVLPIWVSYKSNILRGLRLGLNPSEHPTESAFRAAALAATERSTASAGSQVAAAERWLGNQVPATLKPLLARLIVESEHIRDGKEGEAEKIIRAALDAMGKLMDKKSLDAETKEALSV